jgi:hypothetical protein
MGKITIPTEDLPDLDIDPGRIYVAPPPRPGATALIANPVLMNASLPFKFADGCVLDKAIDDDLELVKKRLNALSPVDGFDNLCKHYEQEAVALRRPSGTGFTMRSLPRDCWRYFVVKSNDRGENLRILHELANITTTPIDIQSLIIYSETGYRYHAETLKRHYDGVPLNRTIVAIDGQELETLKSLFLKWKAMLGEKKDGEEAYPEISRALKMFDALKLLPKQSDFEILSLFAIIEMLVTHEPEGVGDASITKQIRGKMPMLLKRAVATALLPEALKGMSAEKIWNALYDLRSNLAHGSLANFHKGRLASLKSHKVASEYLRDSVASLINLAIHDPWLLRDIKSI